jgi:hypothetical protein
MKNLLTLVSLTIGIIFYLTGSTAFAVHLTCDDQAGVNLYKFQDMPAPLPASTTSVTTGGAVFLDMAQSPTGTYTIKTAACKTDPIWGEACSTYVNFTYTRPAAPVVPAIIRLVAP